MHNPKQLMPEILAALQQGPMTRPLLMTALGCRLQPRYFTYAVTLLVGDQDWDDFSGVAICSPKTHSFDPDGGSLTIGRGKGGKTSTHTVARDGLSALRKMRKATNGPWVFETERGSPLSVDAMQSHRP